MRLVLTLLARNEADVIDANVAFHLAAGVDFVIATDNGSDDGTREVLEEYVREGSLHLISEPGTISQIEHVTRMARLAASEYGADWVINSDADEFWWPRGGSLKAVLAAVPPRFGSIRGMWRHFVARPAGVESFAERMTVRLCAPVTHKDHAFNPHFKTAHRADPEVSIGGGNHDAIGRGLLPLRGWYPIDVLHFPVRSLEQCERKFVERAIGELQNAGSPDARRMEAYEAQRQGRMREFYESHVVADRALEQGLRDGKLAIDTRLRDALRSVPLNFAEPEVDESYVSEFATLEEHGAVVRAQRRIEALEHRLSALETSLPSRLRSRLSRLTR